MALSGTFYGTTSNSRVKPKIVWSATQDILGNYSDVTATLYYSRTNSGYETAGSWTGSITINGVTKKETKKLSITYNSNTLAITNTVRVDHDVYGNKSIVISASGGISISSMTSTSISNTIELDSIPRASTISSTSGDIESRVTIVVDIKNTAYEHSIAYSFGNLSGYIDSDGSIVDREVKYKSSTVNFLLPKDFYAQIPDDPSGECTLTCYTYNGSSLIGSSEDKFTVTAKRSLCAPLVNGEVEDVNDKTVELTGNRLVFVLGQSNAKCTISAAARNSAKITRRTINGNAPNSDNEYTIKGISTSSVSLAAEDSRGYTAQHIKDLEVVPYVQLTCNVRASRVDPDSLSSQLTIEGQCFNGNFGLETNSLNITIELDNYKETIPVNLQSNNTYTAVVMLNDLDYMVNHDVSITAQDALSTVTTHVVIMKSIPVFDWGESDFRFNVPVVGNFQGTFDGVKIRRVRLAKQNSFVIQSKWNHCGTDIDFENRGVGRQTLFIFGEANFVLFYGLIALRENANTVWNGIGNVSITYLQDGKFQITVPAVSYDYCTLLSAESFEIT